MPRSARANTDRPVCPHCGDECPAEVAIEFGPGDEAIVSCPSCRAEYRCTRFLMAFYSTEPLTSPVTT